MLAVEKRVQRSPTVADEAWLEAAGSTEGRFKNTLLLPMKAAMDAAAGPLVRVRQRRPPRLGTPPRNGEAALPHPPVTETSVYAWRERFDNAELNALPAEAFSTVGCASPRAVPRTTSPLDSLPCLAVILTFQRRIHSAGGRP